ncbi:hypothetical protein Mzhil_0815 [Methanosalsum zhilinae DSM 4017]|uniref:Uncharacterized protein n=1 Tax=Methanosalsum zhilinae (strain DSM 4017 / NBRC 107636 / OCM 62 / WeN5) TaxID=679901 RepID=F7XKX9_METZD|nr:hypothetical protein [Methanosalsum zhilinae]AEH60677.1 hypothetical protein Mzhil_0815 [Methanosalsum zhilinae DSM 4017]
MNISRTLILTGILIFLITGAGAITATVLSEDENGFSWCRLYGLVSQQNQPHAGELVVSGPDALEIAKDYFNENISQSNVYLVDRWWVVYHNDGESIQIIHINSMSGEIAEDHLDDPESNDQEVPSNTGSCWC